MKHFSLIILSFISVALYGQEVAKEFNLELFHDDFSSGNEAWTQTYNIDNLFVRQNNTFDLVRRNTQSGYFVIPTFDKSVVSFEARVGFTIIPTGKKTNRAGILVMADKKNSSGILVEVNDKRAYRISRVMPDKLISISAGKNGWVKNTFAIQKKYNEIIIRCHNKVYDLYINQKYIQSFTEIELNRGAFGLYIGPGSRASFDYVTFMGETAAIPKEETILPKETSPEDVTLTKVIIQLRNEMALKNKEIEELRNELKTCQSSNSSRSVGPDTALNNRLRAFSAENKLLKEENDILRTELLKSRAEAKKLQRFKEEVTDNQGGDIVITLTEVVGNQKEKIKELEELQLNLSKDNKNLAEEVRLMTGQVAKRDAQIDKLEQKVLALDSLSNRYKDILLRFQINPENPVAPVEEKPKETKVDTPKEEVIDDDYIDQLIQKQREERRKKAEGED